ncbi:hypothetical protein FE634_12605 [Nocardioides dongxiaopingii]|uniref:hypothetical protein n=1 Tax=Nocardioides sp. S-1144 TaxID=2582905 RepID=UPI00110DD5E7|nr:hypothetical protein [Nocardioides sp. S-1144]QCW51036.1 hypothetical protein FE634_12605 [Nocardioides sp. S-1144]
MLKLGTGPGVLPLVLPPAGLGVLEDKLNLDLDLDITLASGFDIPDVQRARDFVNAMQLDDADLLADLDRRRVHVHE